MKNHMILNILVAISIISGIFALILLVVTMCNKNYIEFSGVSQELVYFEYGEQQEIPVVQAVGKGTILQKDGIAVDVKVQGEVDFKKLGNYTLTYQAKYKDVEKSCSQTFVVKDTKSPVIELVSSAEHFTNPSEAYEEEGYTATDNYDGDITDLVQAEEKDGQVIYRVLDSSGNETSVSRKIIYKDLVAPTISLKGNSTVYIKKGTSYEEKGFIASDDCDGDLTTQVEVSGQVDTNTVGAYLISYVVTDSSGNTDTVKRQVYVYEKQQENAVVDPGDKVVYLTFDDGPGRHTARLLDILDKYGVKATFFVTNQYPDYQHMIGEEYRRGHTVALHSYTHHYNEIYTGEAAFYQDIDRLKQVCVSQTGVAPNILRFPGGTSNTVSRRYCKGIMSTLRESVQYHGYLYCDWNVSSGDAGGTKTAQGVYENVIRGIQKQKVSVVLQHDIHSFSVDAVEKIIVWGLANGYKFLPLTESSPMVHHGVNN